MGRVSGREIPSFSTTTSASNVTFFFCFKHPSRVLSTAEVGRAADPVTAAHLCHMLPGSTPPQKYHGIRATHGAVHWAAFLAAQRSCELAFCKPSASALFA